MSDANDQFKATLERLDAPPPWQIDEEETGVILDANGRDVLCIDTNNTRPDSDVSELAVWIITAVNTCAGFRAVIEPNPESS